MNEQANYAWASRLLGALQALWPLDRPLELVLAGDDHPVWALHDGVADGACNVQANGVTIYLRAHADDTEYWRDVLLHEYTHAAMSGMLEAISNDVPTGIEAYQSSAYVRQMEAVTARVASLLDYAVRTGATVRR